MGARISSGNNCGNQVTGMTTYTVVCDSGWCKISNYIVMRSCLSMVLETCIISWVTEGSVTGAVYSGAIAAAGQGTVGGCINMT